MDEKRSLDVAGENLEQHSTAEGDKSGSQGECEESWEDTRQQSYVRIRANI